MRGQEATVVQAYTVKGQYPESEQAIAPYDPLMVDVSGDDTAYWSLFDRLWKAERTFVIVEHDVVPHEGAIDELLSCGSLWCGFGVSYVGISYAGLACTKFEASLIRKYPDALERVALMEDPGHPPKHWCRLDAWLRGIFQEGGDQMHVHLGPVGHIREDTIFHGANNVCPAHGCG